MKLAVLIPTFFRPDGLRRALQSVQDTVMFSDLEDVEVISVVAHEIDDPEAVVIAKEHRATPAENKLSRRGNAYAWNTCLAAEPDCDAYVLGQDDAYFMYGWLEEVIRCIAAGYGFIGLNDNDYRECRCVNGKHVRNTKWYTNYVMTRDFILDYHGGVMAVPHYNGYSMDVEATQRAKRAGKFVYAPHANVKHDYRGTAGGGQGKVNLRIYNRREANGFPDDFEPIITRTTNACQNN